MKMIYLLIGIASVASSCSETVAEKKIDNIQRALDSIYAENPKSIGILVHIESPKDDLAWNTAIGYSEVLSKSPLSVHHPILVASNTKTYVSAAILRLTEEMKLSIEDPIGKYLTTKTKEILIKGGHNIDSILASHLLSHTSGLNDYAGSDLFIEKVRENPAYQWTRDEQIEIGAALLPKVGNPGEHFKYSDTNYLLLSEIIENLNNQPFYLAIRALLDYESKGLHQTWFVDLESAPASINMPFANQYFGAFDINSSILDHSFDLYGGGGIACTIDDLARFYHLLFNEKIFKHSETLETMTMEIPAIRDTMASNYGLGISKSYINDQLAYGHGGFWGSVAQHFPSSNTTISVVVLERDQRHLRQSIIELILEELN